MNVIYTFADNYAKYVAVSLVSLYENNKDIPILDVYLMQSGLTQESIKRINSVAEKYERKVSFIDSSNLMKNFENEIDTCGFNPVVLSRLFVTQFLPDDMERVVYLDCDTVINSSISYLNDVPFDGNLACMVQELLMNDEYKESIGMKKDSIYFNAGVIVINLDLWRKENIVKEFVSFADKNNGKFLFADQDIINKVCEGRIKKLPQKYNMCPNLPYFPKRFVKKIQGAYEFDDYKDEIKNPCIIHYMGDERPWFKGNFNYYRDAWQNYKKMSPWEDEDEITGKELYLFCYHCLNIITWICPGFRAWFSKTIGKKKMKLFGKE